MSELFKPNRANPRSCARMPYRRRPLLSPAELRFYRSLADALAGRWAVSLKTRLADLVECPPELWDTPHGRRLSQKHVDFVLYHPRTANIAAVLELDDRSHESSDRRARDEFVDSALRCAGIRVLRIRASASYHAETLRRYLDLAMRPRRKGRAE